MRTAAMRIGSIVLLWAFIAAVQYWYDAGTAPRSGADAPRLISAPLVRMFDLGLHTAAASFLWVDSVTNLSFLKGKYDEFVGEIERINDVDPRFAEPYAFAVLIMPNARHYPMKYKVADRIGRRGIAEADPDWRIPFYLGVMHYIELKDVESATHLFDRAGQTIGAPPEIKRFSLNFELSTNIREKTKSIWKAIYENASDEFTRQRAEAYLVRLEMFDLLEKTAKMYKDKKGEWPKAPGDLVAAGILKAVPPDPFGYEFIFQENGVLNVKQ